MKCGNYKNYVPLVIKGKATARGECSVNNSYKTKTAAACRKKFEIMEDSK